jgi:beta-galactosidase/beta-glucuronidase
MLHQKIESGQYISEFKEKFTNFINKAPILASYVVTQQGVDVIHENSKAVYHYDWDFTKHVKTFIHDIKMEIIKHYPRLKEVTTVEKQLTPEQQANLIENDGISPKDVPSSRMETVSRLWRIDKVIIIRDSFILVDEDTAESFRYKMNRSCVYFLTKYRSGEFKSLEDAANYFFKNSTVVNKIEKI